MPDRTRSGCLTRRTLLAAAAGAPLAGAFVPTVVFADAPTDRRFVLLVLRGAMDGLAAVPPFGDPDYRSLRGRLALPQPGAADGVVALDHFYGLHPQLAGLKPLYDQGELAIVHAVATPYRERSHFDAQSLLENGTGSPIGTNDGWLNRALATFGPPGRRMGLALGQTVPMILRGAVPVASWAPASVPVADADYISRVGAMYQHDPLLNAAFTEGLKAETMADRALAERSDPGMMGRSNAMGGPTGPVAKLADTAGRMLAAPDGPRIAVMDIGGWDTHSDQGAAKGGRMAYPLMSLEAAILRLKAGLGGTWRETVVMAVTEFGRTARPNGTNGTDHGTATAAFLAGGAVAGRRVLANWPGLAENRLYQGRDLMPTRDLRALFKAVLRDHLGVKDVHALDDRIFPGSHAVTPEHGLVRV